MSGNGQGNQGGEGGPGPGNQPDPPPPPVQDPPAGGDQPGSGDQQVRDQQQPQGGAGGDAPPAPDWRDRRIGEQQQRLRERNARIAQLEAELRTAHGGQQPPQPQNGNGQGERQPGQQFNAPPSGDIQRQINEAAAALAANQEFTRRCNEVAEAGRKVYNNFDQRVQRLIGLVDGNDPQQVGAYNNFLSAAMETGQATRLIYDLGGDLNEASRIMALEPVKMAVELTRLSARVTTTDQTGAPRPITPLTTANQGQRASIQPDDPDSSDNLSTEEWMRRREEQVASRRQRTLG